MRYFAIYVYDLTVQHMYLAEGWFGFVFSHLPCFLLVSLFTRRLNGVMHVDGLAAQEAGEVLLLRNYKQGRNQKCIEKMVAMSHCGATNSLESLA